MSISLCMIARDEEQTIGAALDSIKPIVDEIIVVDTGSQDNTKNIAKEKGATVIDMEWRDDFSLARNESLKHATKDWILVLDADEIIQEKDHKQILDITNSEDATGIVMLQINYVNNRSIAGFKPTADKELSKGAEGFFVNAIVRLFKNHQGVTYSGAVHENVETYLKNKGSSMKASTVPIHNYGNMDEEKRKRKKENYRNLVVKKIQQEDTAQHYYELGVLQKELGEWAPAVQAQEQALTRDPKFSLAHYELGILHQQHKNYDKSRHHFEESAIAKPSSEAFVGIGMCWYAQGDLKQAYTNLKKALLLNPNNPRVHINLGVVCEKQKKFKDAAKAYSVAAKLNPYNASAHLNLGNALAYSALFTDALQAYQKALDLGHPQKDAIVKRMEEVKKKAEELGPGKVSFSAGVK